MNKNPFQSVAFGWLAENSNPTEIGEKFPIEYPNWTDYPMPPEQGRGGYEAIEMTLGMVLVRTTFEFSPLMLGRLVPLLEVEVEFNEPSFQAMSLRKIHGNVKEAYPSTQLSGSPGIDFFRHTTRYASQFTADGTFSGEACHVSMGRSAMNNLIGEEVTESLLTSLGIAQIPSIVARPIPLHISQLMFNAINPTLSGMPKKLFCQAKILEYLASLVHHVAVGSEIPPEHNQKSRQRSHDIHSQLITSKGKLPTLDELATQHGRSAKLLNEEFALEFGKSIYGFMTDQRLAEAHAALIHSSITIKQIAASLGYSHVNNFTIAFKKKFGYTPGSLRR